MSASLPERLLQHAASRPDSLAFAFMANGQRVSQRSYGELAARAAAVAAGLERLCRPGDRVSLLMPHGIEFIDSFFGCMLAGVVPVPLAAGRAASELTQLAAILKDASPSLILAPQVLQPKLTGLASLAPGGIVDPAGFAAVSPSRAALSEIAFLQYTSGSTRSPRGVVLTHANLSANQQMICDAFGHGPDTVVGGWLPLYHDMGLIGNVLQSVWLGCPCYLMSPIEFVQKPFRWLELISKQRVTTSGAPSFAFDACTKRVTAEQLAQLDLSSWRLAFNGAEVVRWDVMERFAARFAAAGFARRAFYPCYGLAEATLFVTGPERDGPSFIDVDRAALEQQRRALPGNGEAARRLVACGFSRGGLRVSIVDPETRALCSEGRVGEVWLAGPSVAAGYWQATHGDSFGATVAGQQQPGYLRTGDLGFVANGQLYLTGREKCMVIVRGRNYYAEDIEAIVEGAHPHFSGGKAAAFAIAASHGGEALAIVQEVDRSHVRRADWSELREAVSSALGAELGLRVAAFVPVLAGSLPRTSSGKVRRFMVSERFSNDGLDALDDHSRRSRAPEAKAGSL